MLSVSSNDGDDRYENVQRGHWTMFPRTRNGPWALLFAPRRGCRFRASAVMKVKTWPMNNAKKLLQMAGANA